MKKTIIACIVSIIISTIGISVRAAENDIKILIDEQYLEMDVKPVIVSDRTLVPVRAVVENLGGEVEWNGEKSLVTVIKGETTVLLTLNDTVAVVNGKPVELDVPAQIVGERTMVPLRFVAETLGVKVDFYQNTVIILTDLDADTAGSILIIDGKTASGENNGGQVTNGNITVTSPVSRAETATVTFKGKPDTEYTIEVYYPSGKSTARGLEAKTSDAGGNVSWSWKIGGNTSAGEHRIVITDGEEYYETVIVTR